ncbi:MAG: hypothetical protein ACTHK8_10985 [Ginsengibacter sp.]
MNKVDYDKKQIVPGSCVSEANLEMALRNKHSYFIYINVSSTSVKQLRLVTSGLSNNASREKIEEKKELVEMLNEFARINRIKV